MIFEFQNCSLKVRYGEDPRTSKKKSLICLHGFTGSSEDWNPFREGFDKRYNPIAVDFPGHGESDSPSDYQPYTEEGILKLLDNLLDKLDIQTAVFLGYSMGGRAALSYAVHNSIFQKVRIDGLILESSSAGIEDESERKARLQNDSDLGKFIIEFGVEKFIRKWLSAPMWDSLRNLSDEKFDKLFKAKLKNDQLGLAMALTGFSTGRMDYLGNRLAQVKCHVLLLTGRLDSKFTSINNSLKSKFPNAEHLIVPGAGHNTHLENPLEFLNFTNLFLDKLEK